VQGINQIHGMSCVQIVTLRYKYNLNKRPRPLLGLHSIQRTEVNVEAYGFVLQDLNREQVSIYINTFLMSTIQRQCNSDLFSIVHNKNVYISNAVRCFRLKVVFFFDLSKFSSFSSPLKRSFHKQKWNMAILKN
jgi:hypothetical protein